MSAPPPDGVDRVPVTESVRLGRVALDVAREAAGYLREVFRTPMHVADKGDAHDLVTEHDLASERIIRDGIIAREPDSDIRGEEGGSVGTGRYVWHVDPIDGTVNFASGIAFWCISIAVAVDGEVVAGVVVEPVTGTEFTVDQEGFKVNGESIPRGAAATREIGATILCTFPRSVDLEANGQQALDASRELLEAYGSVRAMGSGALQLAHVAAGWGDATFDLHTNPWDVAAGQLMIRAAGGRYVGFAEGVPDEDSQTAYTRPAYWAAGPGMDCPTLDHVVSGLSARAWH